ncbi:MAG TPA: hypothetical protein VLW17_02700 [Thermoanaerobaculaceae bacterium]|nr:hypothetical protein [Thermoanaerobaculaceae bacterium]
MAGIAVEMVASGGKTTVERSNLSGFANFPMSRAKRSAVIRDPGTYRFRVLPPPGWAVTSGNGTQNVTFQSLPGAPADLIAANPTSPVGLAPELAIAGRVRLAATGGATVPAVAARAWVIGPTDARIEVPLAADGSFRIAASPGTWTLAAAAPGGTPRVERRVTVRDAPMRVAALVLGSGAGAPALGPERAAATVDFESVTGTPVAKIPNGFAGLEWNYLNAIEAVWANGDGYVNTVTSGHYVGYSSSGHPVTISRPGGFDFLGAYFGAALPAAEGETLRITAFRDGAKVAEEEFPLSCHGPVWFDASYLGIDRLVLATLHYWQFAVDDLALAVPSAPAARTRE